MSDVAHVANFKMSGRTMSKFHNNAAFEVFSSPDKGLGLKATSKLNPGEAVFSEPAFCYILCKNQRGMRCDFCLNEKSKLLKCSRCKFMYYCERSCQKNDWIIHKQECECLRKVQPKRPPDLCLLAARFIQKLSKLDSQLLEDRLKKIDRFHKMIVEGDVLIDDKRKEMLFSFAFVLQQFVDFEATESSNFKSSQFMGLLCWLSCNCFTILNDEMSSIGTAVYNNASLLNHSCTANCVAVFEKSTITIRTIDEVDDNEELLISYIESLQDTEERQRELLGRYFFKCQCSLCIAHPIQETDIVIANCRNTDCPLSVKLSKIGTVCSCGFSDFPESYLASTKEYYDQLRCELVKFYEDISFQNFDNLTKILERALVCIPQQRIIMTQCFEALFDACIKFEKWKIALKYGVFLLQPYQGYYPDYHPTTGIHLFKLGKIHLYLGSLSEGIKNLQKAKRILSVTHGNNHQLTINLDQMLAEAKEELIQSNNYKHLDSLALED